MKKTLLLFSVFLISFIGFSQTCKPTFSIQSPKNNTAFDTGATITLKGFITNGSCVQEISVKEVGKARITTQTTTNKYSLSFTTDKLSGTGTRKLEVYTKLKDGKFGPKKEISVVIKSANSSCKPTFTIQSPSNNASFNAGATITIRGAISNGSCVKEINVKEVGKPRITTQTTTGNYSLSFTTDKLSGTGTRKLEIYTKFKDGKFGPKKEISVTITPANNNNDSSAVDGGTVETSDGKKEITIVTNDGVNDNISFVKKTTSTQKYVFLITDVNGKILTTATNSHNFEGTLPSVCLVFGLSFTGNLTSLIKGKNIKDESFSSGKSDVSDNSIRVTKAETAVDGGTVETSNGKKEITIITNDSIANNISFVKKTESTQEYIFLITDTNGKILATKTSSHNFEGSPAGICLVFGLSFKGILNDIVGKNVKDTGLSSGAFDVSDNSIKVTRIRRDDVNGGTVETSNGEKEISVITNDGTADNISFVKKTASTQNYVFLITDADGKILTTETSAHNFEGSPAGICLVFGLSFTGTLSVSGKNVKDTGLSSGTFDVSDNSIKVTRIGGNDVHAGVVETSKGEKEITIVTNDGAADNISFVKKTASTQNYIFLITDADGKILTTETSAHNFEGSSVGVCLVFGLSFTGTLSVSGKNVKDTGLSSGTFDVSDNSIKVTRVANADPNVVNGGTVETSKGEKEITIVVNEVDDNIISFVKKTSAKKNYIFLITDVNGNILTTGNNSHNFKGTPFGVCHVFGLSYTGGLNLTNKNIKDAELTSGTSDVSDNFIKVTKVEKDGSANNNNTTTTTTAPATETTGIPRNGQTITIKAKINNRFVTVGSDGILKASKTGFAKSEKFKVTISNGKFFLKAEGNGKFVRTVESNSEKPILAAGSKIGGWEEFIWEDKGKGSFALKTRNGTYVQARNSVDDAPLRAKEKKVAAWEVFIWKTTSAVTKGEGGKGELVSVYPNPVKDVLKVDNNSNHKIKELTLLDLNGKAVFNNRTNNDESNISIDLSAMPKGVYLLRVIYAKSIVTKKIVKI